MTVEAFVLPQAVILKVREHLGCGSRTFDAIENRVAHAFRVWGEKYGPWTPEQAAYAESLIVWAVDRAGKGADASQKRAFVYAALDRLVHHETTHAGFKRRAAKTVSIKRELAELAA